MKNNQGILNLTEKKIYFKFNGEDFIMDLTEGDLPDNWNSFTDKNDVVRDLNFSWDGFSKNDKPSLTIYPLIDNEDSTFTTDFFSPNIVNVKLIKIIGTEGEYFNIPFDGIKTSHFELYDNVGILQLKTKKFNKATDLSILNNWGLVCIDVYGNKKILK